MATKKAPHPCHWYKVGNEWWVHWECCCYWSYTIRCVSGGLITGPFFDWTEDEPRRQSMTWEEFSDQYGDCVNCFEGKHKHPWDDTNRLYVEGEELIMGSNYRDTTTNGTEYRVSFKCEQTGQVYSRVATALSPMHAIVVAWDDAELVTNDVLTWMPIKVEGTKITKEWVIYLGI